MSDDILAGFSTLAQSLIDADALRRFNRLQEQEGFPCPDTGQDHCKDCHGVWLDGPQCGHWMGCPEC